jgi:hypothetical protein
MAVVASAQLMPSTESPPTATNSSPTLASLTSSAQPLGVILEMVGVAASCAPRARSRPWSEWY